MHTVRTKSPGDRVVKASSRAARRAGKLGEEGLRSESGETRLKAGRGEVLGIHPKSREKPQKTVTHV